MERELERLRLARRQRRLGETGDAVHGDRHFQAVPVDARRFGELVVDPDPHPVALVDLDGRAGHRVVEAPDVDEQIGQELTPGVAAIKVEFLDAIDHLPGELLGQVGHDHARRRLARRPEPRHEHPRSVGLPTGPPVLGRSRG